MSNAERQQQRYARFKAASEMENKALWIAHGASGLTVRLAELVDPGKPKDKVDVNDVRRHVDAIVIHMHSLMTVLKEVDPENRYVVGMMQNLDEAVGPAIDRRDKRWTAMRKR